MKLNQINEALHESVNFTSLNFRYINSCRARHEDIYERKSFEIEVLSLITLHTPNEAIKKLMERYDPEYIVRHLILCYVQQSALTQELKRIAVIRELYKAKFEADMDEIEGKYPKEDEDYDIEKIKINFRNLPNFQREEKIKQVSKNLERNEIPF